MGRAYFIKHRTSHLTIELSDETTASAAAARGGKR
jgi:ribosomal protein L22